MTIAQIDAKNSSIILAQTYFYLKWPKVLKMPTKNHLYHGIGMDRGLEIVGKLL
jgi:hypothetical protein